MKGRPSYQVGDSLDLYVVSVRQEKSGCQGHGEARRGGAAREAFRRKYRSGAFSRRKGLSVEFSNAGFSGEPDRHRLCGESKSM